MLRVTYQHRANIGWARSRVRWWCHRFPVCINVCHRWDPTAWLCHRDHRWHIVNHQVRRWQCSSRSCDRSDWCAICSWSNSKPSNRSLNGWTRRSSTLLSQVYPNQLRRSRDPFGWGWSAPMKSSRCDCHRQWCICLKRQQTSRVRLRWSSNYLHWPTVFHSLIVLSRLPLTICRLSAEKATLRTSFLWLTNCRVLVPTDKSQRRKELSHEPLTAKRPSLEMTTSETKCEWPRNALLGTPQEEFSPVGSCWLFNCQMMMDLSRDAERTISGNCGVVAICVTQSLWPTRTPFKSRCSFDMFSFFYSFQPEMSKRRKCLEKKRIEKHFHIGQLHSNRTNK